MTDLTTRYSLRKRACGCSLNATAEGPFVRYDDHAEALATLTRERDEARAALALAYPRALQAAAGVTDRVTTWAAPGSYNLGDVMEELRRTILALTPEDIERLAAEASE